MEDDTSPLSIRQELRRGWRILLASCIGLGLGLSGLPFFTFGTFVVPLHSAFGWSRGQIAAAASALVIGSAITSPIVGGIIDRFSSRRIGAFSMISVAIGYFALTRVNGNIGLFYALWFLLALAGGGTTPVVWTRTVNLWFDRGRGFALGVTLAGAGVASIFGPAFCAALIQSYSWKGGYIGIGALLLVVAVPSILLLFEDQPPRSAIRGAQPHDLSGLTLIEALRTVQFWKIAIGFFVIASPLAATLVNIVPILIDRGIVLMSAARLAGLLGIALVVGRIGVGYLIDRYPPLLVATAMLSSSALGCFLAASRGDSIVAAALSVTLIGLAAGAEIALVAYFSSRYFGMRAYGKIYGWQTTSFYIASATGQLATGLAYDHFHSYVPGLYFTAVSVVVGTCVIASLGKPPVIAQPCAEGMQRP